MKNIRVYEDFTYIPVLKISAFFCETPLSTETWIKGCPVGDGRHTILWGLGELGPALLCN